MTACARLASKKSALLPFVTVIVHRELLAVHFQIAPGLNSFLIALNLFFFTATRFCYVILLH